MIASHNAPPHGFWQMALFWLRIAAIAYLVCIAPSASAATAILHVAKDKTAQYSSVQTAIDAAPEEPSIRVGPGGDAESLELRKPLPPKPPINLPPQLPAGASPPIVLLYHSDADVRIHTIEALAATCDPALIDDLIRAHAVEYYTPVHNAYFKALREMTGQGAPRGPGEWKSWLAQEAAAGRLKVDYLTLVIDVLPADERAKIQPLATQLGPERLDRMAEDLTAMDRDMTARSEALRYMVANDHREDVRKFLSSDWLGRLLALEEMKPAMINALAYQLNGLANPGPVRQRINAQVRECLDSENPIVLANASSRRQESATSTCGGSKATCWSNWIARPVS